MLIEGTKHWNGGNTSLFSLDSQEGLFRRPMGELNLPLDFSYLVSQFIEKSGQF